MVPRNRNTLEILSLLHFVSVPGHFVLFQISLLRETVITHGTTERLLVRMHVLMPVQIAFHSERFPTHVTFVLFLSGVRRQVAVQLSFPPEFSRTVSASVGKVIHVHFAMNAQRSHCLECFAACVTHVGTFSGVSSSVVLPNGFLRKSFSADITYPVPSAFVHVSHMSY